MAFSLVQAGASLQMMDAMGALTTLTLPTGVTLRTDVPPRWAIYQRTVILVNTPSQPLQIDANGVVRLLTPRPPRLTPVLSGVGSSTLSGSFRAKATFVVLDAHGNILSESDYSPAASQVAISAKFLQAANLDISPDTITLRRLYRTTDNGSVYFQWVDLDGNILTSIQDNLSDAGLSIVGAPVLGTPPRLTTIAEFRGRLFGSGALDIDHLRYTEAGIKYAWPIDNVLEIPVVGADSYGIVALLPRREALGVGRRNMLVQITGSGRESGTDTDLDVVILAKELGIESQETAQVFRDSVYFLWKDGVYRWDSSGITCISDGTSDGKGNVRSWFTSDDFFNRDLFPRAFAQIDYDHPHYRLFLASAGSDTIDTWIDYNIDDGTWWGPHTTTLFSPTCAFSRTNEANRSLPVIGNAFSVFEETETRTDGVNDPITFRAIGKHHDLLVPDADKYFGEISVLGKAQSSGHLSVISRTGDLSQTRTITQYWDMRKTRQRLGRLGTGRHTQLELVNAELGVEVELYGYEVDPVNLLGRR